MFVFSTNSVWYWAWIAGFKNELVSCSLICRHCRSNSLLKLVIARFISKWMIAMYNILLRWWLSAQVMFFSIIIDSNIVTQSMLHVRSLVAHIHKSSDQLSLHTCYQSTWQYVTVTVARITTHFTIPWKSTITCA